jgi:hypothetical protein
MELPGSARIAVGRTDLVTNKDEFVKSRIHLVLSVSSIERKRSIGCPLSFARRPLLKQ